jgi:hypothetical protein
MTLPGYVPPSGERDLDKIVRSVRNLYENAAGSNDASSTFVGLLASVADLETRVSSLEDNPSGRELLTANRTYYVRTDGSDSNTGLADTAGGAFLTIQKAYDVITADLDLGGKTVTVQVGAGTYTGGTVISQPWTGGGAVTIQGDTSTPANVIIATNAAATHCFSITTSIPGILTITGFKLTTSTAGCDCIQHSGGGFVAAGANNYGTCTRFHIFANGVGAVIRMQTAYTISGNCVIHWVVSGGYVPFNAAVTLTGTPAFSAEGCLATRTGLFEIAGGSFTGSATGKIYHVELNAVILSSSITMPGNSAGTASTGGQFL